MDEAKLQEIEARANAATPGPWEVGVLRRESDHPTTNQFTEERYLFPPIGESGPVALASEAEFANGAFIAAARADVPDLVAEVRRLTAALDVVTAERDRLQRACDEGLPREYLECPACHAQHIEGPRHDNPAIDGRTRPHHTHRCYHCGHVWDAGRWSFGADVPKPAPESAALATARREGAEEMREACMAACRDALRDPSDIAIIGRVAEAIRTLPLDAPTAEVPRG